MTIRVRHSGHSRVPFMIKSEQERHKHRCLLQLLTGMSKVCSTQSLTRSQQSQCLLLRPGKSRRGLCVPTGGP